MQLIFIKSCKEIKEMENHHKDKMEQILRLVYKIYDVISIANGKDFINIALSSQHRDKDILIYISH